MIRSFHYAASQAVFGLERKGLAKPDNLAALMPAANFWYLWTSSAFLKAYMSTAGAANFLPINRGEAQTLLDVFLAEKAVYELGYELNNRPDWVEVPLAGLVGLLETKT
jgi:maltose alpha-D-glucosyltransferase/alpha-amylase